MWCSPVTTCRLAPKSTQRKQKPRDSTSKKRFQIFFFCILKYFNVFAYRMTFCVTFVFRSLLMRLYTHYDIHQSLLDTSRPLCLLLRHNYRTRMEILRFISAIWYGGPSELEAMSSQTDIDAVPPLQFYVARVRPLNCYPFTRSGCTLIVIVYNFLMCRFRVVRLSRRTVHRTTT